MQGNYYWQKEIQQSRKKMWNLIANLVKNEFKVLFTINNTNKYVI